MLGDKAYDSAELREDLHERGTKPVIPNRCNRKQPFSFNKRIYKLRWRIESAFKLRKMLWNAALRRYYPTVTTSGFTDLKDFFDAAQDQQIRYRSVELMVHPGAREYREESELLVEPWRDRLRFQSTLINFNNLTEKVARSDAEQPPLQRQS